ncbi:carbamoyl-phosphate synthase L subunit-like protein [Stella humosa]|uniref:Carbamoyl-phosphate synthase L subunit-like protein n=1 Tax=Stella humosa TaxID=94 RepID=A0A3N1KKE8_9PROT|nr:alpha-L-glutamate ligase [Stella humosa]ROP81301.1 carbamoyl-phosphate synthase L subunit-like protein [Stella humosa]BBK32650.1 glutathione synthase [Stella humosa]
MARIFVIHENDAWVEPLRAAFAEIAAPYEEWFIDRGAVDLRGPPPEGVFYNRMSASSHTRGHRYAPEHAGAVLAWLERHGRTVVNGSRALALEVSKVAQYQALAGFGVDTPDTIAVIGREHVAAAADAIGYPVILKHNRAGKGLGVRLLLSREAVDQHLESADFEEPIDGITLVQRYIEAPEPFITRVEFIGGRFHYAVRVDTSEGFELCPADQCRIDAADAASADAFAACPATAPSDKFRIVENFTHPLIPAWERFLAANDIGVAGIEFIVDRQGRSWTYDVNTNTNYNPDAEARAGKFGMKAIARHLARLLVEQGRARAA